MGYGNIIQQGCWKDNKNRERKSPLPVRDIQLAEVTLQQTLQSLAVAGLVAGHGGAFVVVGSQAKCKQFQRIFEHLLVIS